jgi:hypothetical protein
MLTKSYKPSAAAFVAQLLKLSLQRWEGTTSIPPTANGAGVGRVRERPIRENRLPHQSSLVAKRA